MADRFPSPFEMPTPPGAEGWQDLYAYSTVFSEDRKEYEDSTFWFMDGVHTPEVVQPWDATIMEFAIIVLSQYNTRHYIVPPALGVDIRFGVDAGGAVVARTRTADICQIADPYRSLLRLRRSRPGGTKANQDCQS